MPIINPQQNEQKQENKPAGIIPGSNNQGDSGSDTPTHANPPRTRPSGWILGLLTIGLLAAGAVAAIQLNLLPGSDSSSTSNTSQSLLAKFTSVDVEGLNLQVDKLVRIAGLANLTEKKIAQNRNALEAASKQQDQIIADTMKLALAQNLKDLKEYRAAQVAQLSGLYTHHQQNPELVEDQFKARLKASDDTFKIGNAKVIQESLALLKSVPKDKDAKAYFDQKLTNKK